jgi:hypothetical protein
VVEEQEQGKKGKENKDYGALMKSKGSTMLLMLPNT